jgi:hypothetical protein
MQLDRNLSDSEGRGKYALVKLRALESYRSDKLFECYTPKISEALKVLENAGVLDWGYTQTESEFFVIRLKDRYAQEALHAYAVEARSADPEWADEVTKLARRAGPANPWCKYPD